MVDGIEEAIPDSVADLRVSSCTDGGQPGRNRKPSRNRWQCFVPRPPSHRRGATRIELSLTASENQR
eukprot:SAG31_NODE_1500_length_8090_cov_10.522588_2_plen_67_part_00